MIAGPVWLIGCGNMGGAMLKGWLSAGLDSASVTVVDPAIPLLPSNVRGLAAVPVGEAPPRLLLLAIKPQMLSQVAPLLAEVVDGGTLIVSILAGIEIATIRAALPKPKQIVRVMPNTPASIGKGISVAYAPYDDPALHEQVAALLAPLGAVEWIEDEALFHAVTALSGSGPAFVFRFMDALAEAGAALGLPKDQALRLAIATVEGSAALAAGSSERPTELAARVTSPNGTTAAGLAVLDEKNAFRALLSHVLSAAARRSEELGRV